MKKIFIALPVIFVIILVNIAIANSATIIVDETQLVNLKVNAVDEDGDPLTYTFGSPLDENGQWQTTYGDYGEYNIEVSVSDGETTTIQEVLLIVNKVNWPPTLEPIEDVVIKETDKLILEPKIIDDNEEDLTVTISKPIGNDGEWETDYEDAGTYKIEVTATDGEFTVSQEFTLTVLEVNRAPEFESYYPEKDFSINEGESIDLEVSSIDLDEDSLIYMWKLDGKEVSDLKEYTYKPNFNSAGMHEIRASASDGKKQVTAIWNVEVLNVNRAPELDIVEEVVMSETDLVILDFVASDPDNDDITVSISEPLDENGEWQTGYEDAGEYFADIEVSDGDLTTTKTIKIIVLDVDRAPLFEKIEDFTIDEGEEKIIELKVLDQDGDDITFSTETLPDGAYIDGNYFVYDVPYYTILKPESWFKNTVEEVHLDEYYYDKEKEFTIKLIAQGKDLTTSQNVKITVNDINLAPELNISDEIIVNEGDSIDIPHSFVYDPDNDEISLTFTNPLDENGKWQIEYDESGVYDIVITASDGKIETAKEVTIIVNDVNRAPIFKEIGEFEVSENQLLSITPKVIDPDNNIVELSVENLPENAAFIEGELFWKPDYDFCQGMDKEIIISFIATDEHNLSSKQDIKVLVKNSNRKPIIFDPIPAGNIIALINKPIDFSANVIDLDNELLSFEWEFGGFKKIVDASPKLRRTFTTPGDKIVKLKVSDGIDTVQKTWKIRVVGIRREIPKTTATQTTVTIPEQTTVTTPVEPEPTPVVVPTPTKPKPKKLTFVIDN
ncbi:PKD domain-containing protein [Candidatus Woesearchaeota archaeon]|nr:PKD domain-containing protein [Candidatus Woesearchaeota archaeon]